MPHTYYGDISGTLDESLDIYKLENLGLDIDELYTWTCGCKTLFEENPECECEIEGENVQTTEPTCIEFHVTDYYIDIIKQSLDEILSSFGEDREEFFNMMLNSQEHSSSCSFNENILITYKELYALYKFGTDLYEYMIQNNICSFYFDI